MTYWPSPDHTCQCPRCTPSAFPPEAHAETRQGEGHIATRFGRNDCMTNVYFDGVKNLRTTECMAGRDGWAIVATEKPHGCRCLSGRICSHVERHHIRLDLWDGKESA